MDNKITHHKVEQNTQEWFDLRLGKFTSSAIHALMSNPRAKSATHSATALTYIEEKAAEMFYNESVSTFNGNFATQWGHDNEPYAMQYFAEIFDKEVANGGFWTKGENGSSPDFIVDSKEIGEIKCFFSKAVYFNFIRTVKDAASLKEFDKKYYYQTQHQLYTTGADKLNMVAFDMRLVNKGENQLKNCLRTFEIQPIDEVFKEFDKRIPEAADMRDYFLKQVIG